MIELVEPLQKEALDQDAGKADDDRRNDQGRPIAEPGIVQQQISRERAQHVLRAVREIDDVEHAEDHGEPEAQQRIERAVDQPDQELAEQRGRGNAEDLEHVHPYPSPVGEDGSSRSDEPGWGYISDPTRPFAALQPPSPFHGERSSAQPLTSGQPPSLSGRNASSAGMVARRL